MRSASIVAAGVLSLFIVACTQFPTEKQGSVDLRPQISFKVANASSPSLDAHVYVNGLDGGLVRDYLEGRSALRVLNGTNRIKVAAGDRVFYDANVFTGDGVSKSLILE